MNKNDEWRVIKQLEKLWDNFPQGEIKALTKPEEPPDFFIIGIDHKITEVEITRFHRKKSGENFIPAEQESLQWRVCNLLAKQISSTIYQNTWAQILFDDNFPIKKKEVRNIASELFNFITQLYENNKYHGQYKHLEWPNFIPKEVAVIHLYNPDLLKKPACTPFGATFIPKLTPVEIQERIDDKNRKYIKFHQKQNKAILIIEIHGFKLASIGELSYEALIYEFQSPFDHIFVIIDGDQLIELNKKSSLPTSKKIQ